MKALLIQILLTCSLLGCAELDILSELMEISANNRQHKCNMDATQCEKYGIEQDKPKRKCRSRTEVDCWTVYSGND